MLKHTLYVLVTWCITTGCPNVFHDNVIVLGTKAIGASGRTAAMTLVGTPHWTAPEIFKGLAYNEKVNH